MKPAHFPQHVLALSLLRMSRIYSFNCSIIFYDSISFIVMELAPRVLLIKQCFLNICVHVSTGLSASKSVQCWFSQWWIWRGSFCGCPLRAGQGRAGSLLRSPAPSHARRMGNRERQLPAQPRVPGSTHQARDLPRGRATPPPTLSQKRRLGVRGQVQAELAWAPGGLRG